MISKYLVEDSNCLGGGSRVGLKVRIWWRDRVDHFNYLIEAKSESLL